MLRTARVVAGTAATALVATAAAALLAAPPAGAAGTTTRLAGDVLPQLSTYRDLGLTDPAKKIQVDVTIARPNPAGEQARYEAMYTKGSPYYHQFLTPAQFNAQFGVSPATYSAVRDFATAHGLTVASSPGSRDLIVLEGTVAQVQQTFATSIHDFRPLTGGKTFYANTRGPAVPSGLSITGVIGLNNKLGMHLFHNGPDNPLPASATHGVKPAQDSCQAGTCTGLTTPQDLWSIYEQPGGATAKPINNTKVNFGQGQRMAVFGEGQTTPVITNLRTFERLHGLPRVPIKVVHADGSGVSYTDNAGEVEWDLRRAMNLPLKVAC